MPFYKWSKTPGNNAGADPSINWAEGMAPSAVNDSARAQMARTAEWRDDVSGTITTAGTSTAYTLATNQVFDNLADMNGGMVAFVPHTTNGATVTLNVDGLGAKPLRLGPGLELQSGVLIQGTPYVASYNNSDGAWYLQGGFANPYGIPLGGMMPYIGASAPNSAFTFPSGQAISRTTYATLFALVVTTYGAGDGSTTFNLPDLRGRMIAHLDGNGFGTIGRITVAGGNFDGTVLGGTGGAQNHTLTTGEMPVHNHGITDPGHNHTGTVNGGTVITGIGGNPASGGGQAQAAPTVTINSNTTGITINNAGSGSAHTVLNPMMTLPYILRVI
jgi:microcystin-dependent protein